MTFFLIVPWSRPGLDLYLHFIIWSFYPERLFKTKGSMDPWPAHEILCVCWSWMIVQWNNGKDDYGLFNSLVDTFNSEGVSQRQWQKQQCSAHSFIQFHRVSLRILERYKERKKGIEKWEEEKRNSIKETYRFNPIRFFISANE